MTSWRDTASTQAQDDLDGLLNLVLPVAEETLGRHGELYPFGAVVSPDGEAALTTADHVPGEHPEPGDVLTALYDAARANADAQRAVAFVADVRADDTDAVRVELEHAEGVSLVVMLAYTRSKFRKALTFGQMSALPAEPRVWTTG